ncbi:MAG TPA: hypothetical protein K8V00_01870 [Ligilactobacillus acidipiscis]|uniref:DNA-directed DNA polymerase n=1 Tax=Ligilactobacillus acidipiscis TaxID=89059 RepID=A0A921F6Q0_9LACO|nr:hypothetical protein [Ligilactobacillus acidipiscis]
MENILFYDYESFIKDWLVVILDTTAKQKTVIINDREQLIEFHEKHQDEIWVGYNNNHYDQYIHKAIICGFDPHEVNEFIITQNKPGWKFSSLFRKVKMINYDVMIRGDGGLKTLEGFLGTNIKESKIPFDIKRKLTAAEIEETVAYCTHDVENTLQVFLNRKSDFEAQMQLAKLASNDGLNLYYLSRTKAQMAAIILGANKHEYSDEFKIDFPKTLKLEKYTNVLDWYKNPENRDYTKRLETDIAGVPHIFAWGGVHGAKKQYFGEGYYLNMDVTSLYPSLMIQYDLMSRSVPEPKKFEEIYKTRVKYKREKNPLQAPLKIVINSTYGAMKDRNNALYDPREANRVCIYGQLLILDLIEKLEDHCEIIQSNTDGILIKMKHYEDYNMIDDIAYEWEQRTGLNLEFSEYRKVFQKDVNNYVMVAADGHVKTKGGYVKKLNPLDNDLPIINKALNDYFVYQVPIEATINGCDDLEQFQLVAKLSYKYKYFTLNGEIIPERCVRVFASNEQNSGMLLKFHATTGRPAKFPNSPEKCFLWNDEIKNQRITPKLDKQWYIDLANKRLEQFGVENNGATV